MKVRLKYDEILFLIFKDSGEPIGQHGYVVSRRAENIPASVLVLINSESEVQKPQMDLPEEAVPDEESNDGELKGEDAEPKRKKKSLQDEKD
ncbi:hypothetical protein DAPPUDRAFT_262909 [Daphnia pulex]|uniref:Uncharacterized protein n=1 Tax=Daphnia pulex TaxID=6669 RepID=E9HNW9_DAPPU|nr:hypothetical protein DAPPUDRAFT_262909 [Daphnia pulex]|eukprot:EFX66576.1 hypothetical protein DAPPUDRAFT_262909 [Daphnia pulex]